MKLKNSILAGCTALVVATSCTQRAVEKQTWVEKAIENAHAQIGLEIDTIESSGRFLNPVTTGGAAFSPAVYGICMN